jgi:hypothetical protein
MQSCAYLAPMMQAEEPVFVQMQSLSLEDEFVVGK